MADETIERQVLDALFDGLSLARSRCYVTQVNAKPDNTARVGSCGPGSGHTGRN